MKKVLEITQDVEKALSELFDTALKHLGMEAFHKISFIVSQIESLLEEKPPEAK